MIGALFLNDYFSTHVLYSVIKQSSMSERGGRGGRGGGRGGGRSRGRAKKNPLLDMIPTADLGIPGNKRGKAQDKSNYDPQPTFPKFTVPRPAKLKQEEINVVRYYKSLRTKIQDETPFYIMVRKRGFEEDEDDDRLAFL